MANYIVSKCYEYQIEIEADSEEDAKAISEQISMNEWMCVDVSYAEVFEVED